MTDFSVRHYPNMIPVIPKERDEIHYLKELHVLLASIFQIEFLLRVSMSALLV